MFTDIGSFLGTGIPALIAGIKPNERAYVLLANYNCVGSYESGPVATGKQGLMIEVQNGNLKYSPTADLIYAFPSPICAIGAEAMDAEAGAAQAIVESATKIEQPEADTAFIAVVYAGLSAFGKAVNFARKIKQDKPAAKVVVLTCDCDLRAKEDILRSMLQSHDLEAVIVDHECGGRGAMRDILREFVRVWPPRSAEAAA
jgi:hypothetical protein